MLRPVRRRNGSKYPRSPHPSAASAAAGRCRAWFQWAGSTLSWGRCAAWCLRDSAHGTSTPAHAQQPAPAPAAPPAAARSPRAAGATRRRHSSLRSRIARAQPVA